MRTRVHAIVVFDVTVSPPVVIGVRILSSDAGGTRMVHGRQTAADLFNVEAGSFGEGRRLATELIDTNPAYAWARPLLART